MDRSRGCHQNHGRYNALIQLAEDYLRYRLSGAIVSHSGIHFSSTMVTYFFKDLGVQTRFVYVVHLQANSQAESTHKVILKGLKRKLDDDNGLWPKLLPEILWSYHTNT